jgi:hypothetical protein
MNPSTCEGIEINGQCANERLPFFTTANASGRIASTSAASTPGSSIFDKRSFHSRVFARRASSDKDWRPTSISLICFTMGNIRRNSRWFFEPMIFLRIQLNMMKKRRCHQRRKLGKVKPEITI